MLFTWASIYRRQLQRGDPYLQLRPVISIWFCDRNVIAAPPGEAPRPWHSRWKVRDEAGTVWCSDLEIHLVELERWRRAASAAGRLDERWVRFLAEAEDWVDVPEGLSDPLMEKAMHVLEKFQHDPRARTLYEARVKEERLRLTQEIVMQQMREAKERAEAGWERAEAERERAEAERDAMRALLRAHGLVPPGDDLP